MRKKLSNTLCNTTSAIENRMTARQLAIGRCRELNDGLVRGCWGTLTYSRKIPLPIHSSLANEASGLAVMSGFVLDWARVWEM